VRRETVKRRVGPALYQVMEPGDQIIAGVLVITGPSAAWDLFPALCAVFCGVLGSAGLFSSFSPPPIVAGLGIATVLLTLPLQLRRRPLFVAVTQRQLICYRMSKLGTEPSSLLFCAPLTAVRMTRLGGRMPHWASVRYTGPGADDQGLRFNINARWRKDLNDVMTAPQAGGAAVDGQPPGRPALQSGFPVGTDTAA